MRVILVLQNLEKQFLKIYFLNLRMLCDGMYHCLYITLTGFVNKCFNVSCYFGKPVEKCFKFLLAPVLLFPDNLLIQTWILRKFVLSTWKGSLLVD